MNKLELIPFSDLFEINPKTNLNGFIKGEEVSFLPMGVVSDQGQITEIKTKVFNQDIKGYTCFSNNDVLIAKITPCFENGKGCLVKGLRKDKGVGSTEFIILRSNIESDEGFIFHTTQSKLFRDHGLKYMSGSAGQQRVGKDSFHTFIIPKLPLLEQKAITKVLDTLDITIQKTEAIIDKLQNMKDGLLQDLLTRGVDAQGKLRPTSEDAPELYKESPLGFIPREWSYKKGSELCHNITVGIVIRPTQYYRSSGIMMLRSANIRENQLELDDLVYMTEHDHLKMRKSAVEQGNVLTVRTGYPGTSCVYDLPNTQANCIDILISKLKANIIPSFYCYWLNSQYGKGEVLKRQGGGAQQHFNQKELTELLFAYPSLKEQKTIVSLLDSTHNRIKTEQMNLNKLRLQKSGLMKDLLTGKVRVTPLLKGENS